MKTNREMRREAWKIVRGKWFWRLASAGLLLNCIAQAVMGAIRYYYGDQQIQTWTGFFESKLKALQGGLDLTVPSSEVGWRMTGASAFEFFIGYLFAAILAFGVAGLMLKAIRNDEQAWLSEAFGGYRRPLEVTWLLVRMNLQTFLWSLLLVFPGIVAAYRYRQTWYLKAENPDWSAGRCLRESGRMMKGFKWRAFCFDCSYAGWLFLLGVLLMIAAVLTTASSEELVMSLTGAVAALGAILAFAYAICYYFVGRTIFYREVKAQGAGRETAA